MTTLRPADLRDVPVAARGAADDAGVRWRSPVTSSINPGISTSMIPRRDFGDRPRAVAGIGDLGALWVRGDADPPGQLRLEVMSAYRSGYPKDACDLRLPREAVVVLAPDRPATPAVWRVDRDAGGDLHCYALPWPGGPAGGWKTWSAAARESGGVTALICDLAAAGCDPWAMRWTPPPPGGLLPPGASPLERELARVIVGRLGALDAPLRALHDPAACPPAWLPVLAWQRRVQPWDPAWPPARMREAIASSAADYRAHGTVAGDRAMIESLGQPYLMVERPDGRHHEVLVRMYSSAARAADPSLAAGIAAAMEPVRRASVVYTSEAIDPDMLALAPTVGRAAPIIVAPPQWMDLRGG